MKPTTPEAFMRRAVALSRRGYPAPNPHVGCVIVKGGQVVGEGYHDHRGGPHAEVMALQQAGREARGAVVFVTLEPCDHDGLTPPCSHALVQAGVKEVHYACADPNPKAAGGADTLRSNGIEVTGGLLETEARQANLQFMSSFELGRPYVVLKAAVSMDGRISLPTGESKWITGVRARKAAHKLRALSGAVLVGRETVLKDDPSLTARIKGVVNQPLRVVLDPDRSLSDAAKVFTDGGRTLRVVKPGEAGLEVPFHEGRFDLAVLMQRLVAQGVNGLLVEGGAFTLNAFIEAELADRVELFVAPITLGAGPSWLSGEGVARLAEAHRFRLDRAFKLGDDIQLTFLRA